jgi:hypothetical protein
MDMQRVAVLAIIAALAIMPTGASAQGFLDGSFLGPYFGMGGASSCDEVKQFPPCVFYVGYSGDPGNSTGFGADTREAPLGNVLDFTHQYAVRGVWLGASKTIALSRTVGVVGSFWYLFPDRSVQSRETYSLLGGVNSVGRTWSTTNQWWYADLLGAFGSLNGFSFLAGFRYDFFTTQFRNPVNAFFGSLGTDTADVRSNGYIPLIGGQMAYAGSNSLLLFRLVGLPALVGRVTYDQTIGGFQRLESSGSYKGGYFIEAFTEYAYAINGKADLGFFARWNSTHGVADLNTEGVVAGFGVATSRTFGLGVNRNDWTLGGRLNLKF